MPRFSFGLDNSPEMSASFAFTNFEKMFQQDYLYQSFILKGAHFRKNLVILKKVLILLD